jgi:hypothetical protein
VGELRDHLKGAAMLGCVTSGEIIGEMVVDRTVRVGLFHIQEKTGEHGTCWLRIIPLRFAQRQNKSGEMFGLPEKSLEITAAPALHIISTTRPLTIPGGR